MLDVRGARPDEIDAAIACCAAAFGGDDPARVARLRDFFSRIHKKDPFFRPENTRIALLDGRIVSVVQVFDRQMLVSGVPVRMGGLGSVGTHPDYRHRGYGTRVLEDTIRYMEEAGFDVSLLFTGINDYYARLGWRSFPYGYALRMPIPESIPAARFRGDIRTMNWKRDLDIVMRIHAEYNKDVTGPTLRPRAFWEAHRLWRPFDTSQFQLAVANGKTIAYRRDGDAETIEEIGCLPGEEDALFALIFDFMRQARIEGKERIQLRGNPALARPLASYGFSIEQEPQGWFMYRIVRFAPLLEKLLPAMAARWRKSAFARTEGLLSIESDAGDVMIRARQGTLSVHPGNPDLPAHIRLELPHKAAIELVFGHADAKTLLERHGTLRIPIEQANDILTVLFPPCPYRWYDKDGF